jgi:hypothetical protein
MLAHAFWQPVVSAIDGRDCTAIRAVKKKSLPVAGLNLAQGESGGLKWKRRGPAAALARALAFDGAAPECALGIRDDRQGRARPALPGPVRRLPLRQLPVVHGG